MDAYAVAVSLNDSGAIQKKVAETRNAHIKYAADLRERVEPGEIFVGLHELRRELAAISEGDDGILSQPLSNLAELIREFEGAYTSFLKDSVIGATAQLLAAGDQLARSVSHTRDLARAIRDAIAPGADEAEGEESLDLFFPSPSSPAEVAEKLVALDHLYGTITTAQGIDPREHPLRLVYLGVGGLSTFLRGASTTMKVIQRLLRRNTAVEQLATMRDEADLIRVLNEMAAEGESRGEDHADTRKFTRAALASVAEDLARLTRGETAVYVNGERIEVRNEGVGRLLAGHSPRLLGRGAGVESTD